MNRAPLSLVFILVLFGQAVSLYAGQPLELPKAGLSKELLACLAKDENDFDLELAAILIAKEEFPEIEVPALTKELRGLSDRLMKKLSNAGTARDRLAALKNLLFDEEKFEMPKKDDAAAFLISGVLKNKRGNCLGLSTLSLILADDANLKLHGVPVPSRLSGPGHLLVRYDDGRARMNFDCTERGAEHPDEYYQDYFKLTPETVKKGYALGNAKKRDVANLLLINLAGYRVEVNRAAEALPLLEAAKLIRADYPALYNNFGMAFVRLEQAQNAENAFRKALELEPLSSSPHLGLAELGLRSENYVLTEKEIQAALAVEPENLQAQTLLGNLYLARKDYRSAKAVLLDVTRAAPKDALAQLNLGAALRLDGDFQGAEDAFKAAIDLNPANADAWFGLAETYRATAKIPEAEDAYASALKAEPKHTPSQLRRAAELGRTKKFSDAEKIYTEILKQNPSQREALTGLLQVLEVQNRAGELEGVIVRLSKESPNDVRLLILLGQTRVRMGKVREAIQSFTAALGLLPDAQKNFARAELAVCQGKMGDHKRALEMAEENLRTDAKDVTSLKIAAIAAENLKNFSKSKAYAQRILEILPEDEPTKKLLKRIVP